MMLGLQSTGQISEIAQNLWLVDDMTRNLLTTCRRQTSGTWSWDIPTSSSVNYYEISNRGTFGTEPNKFLELTAERAWEETRFMVLYHGHQYLLHEMSTRTTHKRDQLKKYAEIAVLEREYHYVSRDVKQYILRNQDLIEPLVEIKKRLEKYFGEGVDLYLEYLEEPEEDFESLYISVLCHCGPEEAMDLLTRFYHDWWLAVDFQIRRHIAFTPRRA